MSVCVLVAQSRPTLCNPIDCSPPGPSVHWILQARTLEWVAISFSKRNYRKKESEVTQSSPTVCDPMDCSLPGSSIHGISQARVLEGVAMSFSMRSPHSTLILSIPPLQEPILLSILLFWGLGGVLLSADGCISLKAAPAEISNYLLFGGLLIWGPVS